MRKFSQMNNLENFSIGIIKICMPTFALVKDGLEVPLYISCYFDFD